VNLEDVEQRMLAHLKGSSNPLVRFDTLYAHLNDAVPSGELTRARLLDFLREHEMVRLIEGAEAADDPLVEALAAEGFMGVPYVILESRIPTADQLTAMMVDQLDRMGAALSEALAEARAEGDAERTEAIQNALWRTSRLKRKLAPGIDD
jgi:hypothetical protein